MLAAVAPVASPAGPAAADHDREAEAESAAGGPGSIAGSSAAAEPTLTAPLSAVSALDEALGFGPAGPGSANTSQTAARAGAGAALFSVRSGAAARARDRGGLCPAQPRPPQRIPVLDSLSAADDETGCSKLEVDGCAGVGGVGIGGGAAGRRQVRRVRAAGGRPLWLEALRRAHVVSAAADAAVSAVAAAAAADALSQADEVGSTACYAAAAAAQSPDVGCGFEYGGTGIYCTNGPPPQAVYDSSAASPAGMALRPSPVVARSLGGGPGKAAPLSAVLEGHGEPGMREGSTGAGAGGGGGGARLIVHGRPQNLPGPISGGPGGPGGCRVS